MFRKSLTMIVVMGFIDLANNEGIGDVQVYSMSYVLNLLGWAHEKGLTEAI